jgi:peptidoglycan/LPS O-acetylase OafA/YrhL
MIDVVLLRANERLHVSDVLSRGVVFIPLFLRFLMSAHRASVLQKVTDPLVNLLSSKFLVSLGNLAFPIFVLHGPLGQLFYKKIIATKLFGGPLNTVCGPWFFYVYLATVLGGAWLLQKLFLTNKAVSDASSKTVESLAAKL